MAKWHDRRSECVKSYSKAYGTMYRRQKYIVKYILYIELGKDSNYR
jgi:hypothetical protein